MTVLTQSVSHSYKPGAANAPEAIPFPFFAPLDLTVTHIADATGARTLLVPGVDYVIAGNGRTQSATITALGDWPADDLFEIARGTPLTQEARLVPGQAIPAKAIEDQLDRVTMRAQEDRARTVDIGNRALLVRPGQTMTAIDKALFAGKFWAGDALGNLVPATPPVPGSDAALRADLADPAILGAQGVGVRQSGAGASTRTMQGWASDRVSVKDFGAVGDGVTNDTAAFWAAAVFVDLAGGGEVFLPRGTYVVDEVLLAGLSNILFYGPNATIKGPASRVLCYFNCTNAQDITFRGIRFDQMKSSLPLFTALDYNNGPLNVPIYANGGTTADIAATDCRFDDLYTTAIYFDGAVGLTVSYCRFKSAVQTQDQWMQHIHLQTATDIIIEKCRFANAPTINAAVLPGGIYASGVRRISVTRSYLDYCGRDNSGTHRVAAIDFYGDVTDVFVLDNVLVNCMAVSIRLNACFGAKISGNRFQVNANAEIDGNTLEITGSVLFGQNKGQRDIEVSGNRFEDSGRAAGTVVIVAYDWGAPSRKIRVTGNIFNGCRNIVRVIGPHDRVAIERSVADSGRSNIVVVFGSGFTSLEGAEADSIYDGLRIIGNELNDDTTDNANGIIVDLNNAATTAFVGSAVIEGNKLRASAGSTAPAITMALNSTTLANGRSWTRRNEVRGYAIGVNLVNHGEAVVEHNRMIGTTTPIAQSGMATPAIRRGNRYATGPSEGTAALIAGVANIVTDEVVAGDRIFLQRVGGGAPGILVVESITGGAGFQVRSKDSAGATVAADTGQFNWAFSH